MSHSLETWQLLIRAAGLLGYLQRSMSLGGEDLQGGGDLQVAGSIVISTLSVTEKGEEILENPQLFTSQLSHSTKLPRPQSL